MNRIWNLYREQVHRNCIGDLTEEHGLDFWRNRLFASILTYLLPLGILIILPAVYTMFMLGQWGLATYYTLFMFTIMLLGLFKGLHIAVRKLLFIGFIYIIGLVLLFYTGIQGAGLMYLFGVTIFALLIYSKEAGFWTVVINAAFFLLYGALIYAGIVEYTLRDQYQVLSWFTISANNILLSGIAVTYLPMIFDGLLSTIEKQRRLEQMLRLKQRELEDSLEEITEKNQAVEFANKRYNILTKLSNEVIWEWNLEDNHHLWISNDPALLETGQVDGVVEVTSWLDKIHPDDRERVKKSFFGVIESEDETQWEAEYRFQKEDGSYANVFDKGTVIRNRDGKALQILGGIQDVTELKRSEKFIRRSLKEKETLLAEIHHRVKNNLALISSMLQLQAFKDENKEFQSKLLDSTIRIKSIANIHEQLYQASSFSEMEFGDSIRRLIVTIQNTIQTTLHLDFEYDLDSVELKVTEAIPCSLIVNEVITNIIKHAYPERDKGEVQISLKRSDESISLTIQDDGVGLPEDFNEAESGSLGLQLIQTLSKQIGAEYTYSSCDKGTTFKLNFSVNGRAEPV
ncbi:MAG: PAS domain-containing protein [Balneolaceae bacterium]|nr:PAS domain-containing protein [Balneolaceae bacterium]MCH8548891.1 PAS domain-containing protein [Balneolaceae bacterium]